MFLDWKPSMLFWTLELKMSVTCDFSIFWSIRDTSMHSEAYLRLSSFSLWIS